jgi:hypothetical protein
MAETLLAQSEEHMLQVAAHHREDFDASVIQFDESEHQQIASSLMTVFRSQPVSDLGYLDNLPYELKLSVLSYLDVESFLRFRQVNRRLRIMIHDMDQYRALVKHGSDALLAVFRTGMTSRIRFTDLYLALCTRDCYICGSFGGFLWIPTAQRCCFGCIEGSGSMNDMRIVDQQAYDFGRWFQFQDPGVVASLLAIPGTYGLVRTKYRNRMKIIYEKPSEKWGIGDMTNEYSTNLRHLACIALPWFDNGRSQVEVGLSCRGCDPTKHTTGTPRGWPRWNWARMYSRKECLEHFRHCEAAKVFWEAKLAEPDDLGNGDDLVVDNASPET